MSQEYNVNWSDLLDSSSENDEEKYVQESSEDEIEDPEVILESGLNDNEDEISCSCFSFDSTLKCLNYLMSMLDKGVNHLNFRCDLNNMIKVFNYLILVESNLDNVNRLFACDLFYRVRHEFLFKTLLMSLNLPQTKTDIPFTRFGIDSNRTPDLIIENSGELLIIEVSASSNFDRIALSKGLEEAGFESKYKVELDMLKDKDIKYTYLPFLFDMSNPGNLEYQNSFDKLPEWIKVNQEFKPLLKIIKEIFCIITIQLKSYIIGPSSILFTDRLDKLKKKHNDLNFLLKIGKNKPKRSLYKEFCISPPVYNKIINNWHRLSDIVTRNSDNEKIQLVLDAASHKLFVTTFQGKYTVNDYLKVIDDNDKFKLFQMLKLKIGKGYVSAVDSTDGVKFIEETKEKHSPSFKVLDEIVDHPPIQYFKEVEIDMTRYSNVLKSHFEYDYIPADVDENFEENFIKLINNNDMSQDYNPLDKAKKDSDYQLKDSTSISNDNLDRIIIEEVFDNLISTQCESNKFDESIPLKIQKNKSPFLLPIALITKDSYTDLNYKNSSFIEFVKNEIELTDPYTSVILREVLDETYEFIQDFKAPSEQYNKMKIEKQMVSREITKLSREYYRFQGNKSNLSLKDCKTEPFFTEFNKLNSRIREISRRLEDRGKMEKIKNETQLIRLPTKNKKSALSNKFMVEMQHYKNKSNQSTITGIGYRNSMEVDFTLDRVIYDNVTDWLTCYAGENPNLLIDDKVSDDVKLLKELKTLAVNEYKELIDNVKNSFLGHASSFVSNLAHSLLYYSQMPFNSDYVRVDNLGIKDVLLIVRGGKKIFKSKSSKMYRLLYPVSETIVPWFETGKGLKSSTTIIRRLDKYYALTPWQGMHESILNDSVSFYTRVISFTVLNLNPSAPFNLQFPRVSFNVMLAFHNRRHTEVMLANLRYILLATLGDLTGIASIFKEFLGFNYDCFQSFIRGCILLNYPNYFKELKKVKNIKGKTPNFESYLKENPQNLFTGGRIQTEEDLALMIYSTFLMTKAPYQRPAERARNLRGILDIHDYFSDSIGLENSLEDFYNKTTVRLRDFDSLSDYNKKIFDNDFYFDPHYCSKIGEFADSYFESRSLKDDIFVSWNSIINQSWDELATSTGLRGKFEDLSTFWGQKGYFVVYKDLISDKSYMDSMSKLIKCSLDIDKKRKMLRELNVVYKAKVDDVKEYLLFHAVDKVQWRGGREIYVMDIETKTVQQPIEKFMGFLCSKIDNELISIPSDRRAQVIHHSIFEKDLPMSDTLTWYLTLDCSKWAPKSNFLKFISLILSMQVIPPTFKTHFMNYCQKLFKKRIYFNQAEVDVLRNNLKYKVIVEKYLQEDKVRGGYFLYMPYSWVMGIFNYTSSFLHSLNQKYSEYIIFKTSLISYSEETALKMFAHSDDSGGRVTCSNEFMLKRCLCLYELQLKMCNHILSKKKSVVSRFYFEILSVIYIFKKLLALLPKFLGGLRFTPSDKGPAQDMLASYSKSIEVMVAGASFNLSYLVMKFYSAMVFRFYNHSRKLTDRDYLSPVQYLGMPDAHPLMVLLCGSDSDIVRLISIGKEKNLVNEHSIISKLINTIDDEGPIKPIKFNISVRGLKKGFEDYINYYGDELKSWSISNVNFHSTPFNFLSFLRKLNDPGFVGSLVNESTTRRLSRSYFMRKGQCINSTIGVITLENFNDVRNLLTDGFDLVSHLDPELYQDIKKEVEDYMPISIKQIEVLKETLVSPLRVCRYMNEITLEGKQITLTNKTLKPTHIELLKSSRTFTCNFDPAQMVSYIKEPELSWALPNLRNLHTAKLEVENMCLDMGFDINDIMPSTLLKLCRNHSNKHTKEIYLYSRIPGEIRNIKTYSAFLTFLSTNTFPNKEIKGMVLNLKRNLTNPGYLNINIDEDIYIINNILSVIHIFLRASSVEFMESLNLKQLKILNWKGGKVHDLVLFIDSISKTLNSEHYNFQLSYIKNELLNKFSGECNGEFLKLSSYYYFPKTQKSRQGWYGSGILTVCIKNNFYKMNLYNNLVVSMESNISGKIPKDNVAYITDVLNKSGLSFSNKKIDIGLSKNFDLVFGLDNNGDYSITKRFEITIGVPAFFNPVLQTPTLDCELYRVSYLTPNSFLLKSDVIACGGGLKVYTLPLMQGEILNIIRMLFKPEDFEAKLLEEGLGDFEDYILTEIMTNFGGETFVNPYDFFDNFQSSKVFQIFKEIKEKGIAKLPNKPQVSALPANEGGLLRLLLDYTRETNSNILKTVSNLTPEIMELRSQYPETVSVILSENLVKFHEKIYTTEERLEIKDAYQGLYKYQDFEELKKNAIKLMAHWGYGSLVNTIENYSMAKNIDNYWYFAMDKSENLNSILSKELFVKMHKMVTDTMIEFSFAISNLELVLPNFKIKNNNIKKFINEYNTSISNNCYNNVISFSLINLNHLIFCNYFISLLKDDEFVNNLSFKFNSDYILCSLDVNFRNRGLLIPLYNNFYYNFVRTFDIKKELDYIKKVERLSSEIIHPKTIFDTICSDKYKQEINKYNPYYHNFLTTDFFSYIQGTFKTFVKGVEYRVSQSFGKKSTDVVRVCSVLPLGKVYNPEIFEDENWEEIDATIEMGDPDPDEIQELLELIPNKFKKTKTKKLNLKNPVIQCEINWVIDPFIQNKINNINHYRQSGENLVIVSTEYIEEFLQNFPNSQCRRVNFTKKLKVEMPDFLLHISCNKCLNDEFWDNVVGGTKIELNDYLIDKVFVNKFITKKGEIGGIYSLGKSFEEIFEENWGLNKEEEKVEGVEPEVVTKNSKSDEIASERQNNVDIKFEEYKELIKQKLDEAVENKIISRALRWRLLDKYTKNDQVGKFYSFEEKFLNCLNEIALGKINSDFKKGEIELSKDDYVKVFLAPTHFGLAQNFSRNDPKNIKDKKIVAELNSLNEHLSSMVASGTLTVSKNFYNLVLSNYKLWVNITRGTKYKRENKKFLLILFLTILNSAKVLETSPDDHIWQNIINLITPYMADDGPDCEDSDAEFLDFDINISHSSRLLYKVSGLV